jgi:hypothetical protein
MNFTLNGSCNNAAERLQPATPTGRKWYRTPAIQ